jgi:hypothetical protein
LQRQENKVKDETSKRQMEKQSWHQQLRDRTSRVMSQWPNMLKREQGVNVTGDRQGWKSPPIVWSHITTWPIWSAWCSNGWAIHVDVHVQGPRNVWRGKTFCHVVNAGSRGVLMLWTANKHLEGYCVPYCWCGSTFIYYNHGL